MTLSTALRSATSSLASHSQQLATLSRNISGVGDTTYVRRNAQVYTDQYSITRVEVTRYVNQSVHSSMLNSQSDAAAASALATGVDNIAALQDSNSFAFSPASLLAQLKEAVEFSAAAPSDQSAMISLVEQARGVSNAINASYQAVLDQKEAADKAVAASVENINSILSQIKQINDVIVVAAKGGKDDLDSMDVRDQLVSSLAEEIGIKVLPDDDNGIMITTSSGAMLFDTQPRDVSFDPILSYGPNTTGNELRVDGVTVSGPNATLKINSGKIAGNLELRDGFLQTQQNQLDELARGLVEMFSEQDQTAGGKPALAGLFTWSGGPTVPASATLETGIAWTLSVNPLVDQQQGGNPELLRDGAINGDADYTYNTTGASGFSDRLYELADAFEVPMTFDASVGLPASASMSDYAAAALDSLNSARTSALNTSDYRTELSNQLQTAFFNETGVNLDYELSRLLEVERTYQASARVVKAVDDLLLELLGALR